MIGFNNILNQILCNNNLLVTKGSDDPLVWYFFLFFLLIIGIVAGVLIFYYSKNPKDWEHIPTIDDYFAPGKLQYFAESMKMMPVDYSDTSSMKEYIQIIFFEKIRASHGISVRELFKLKEQNPNKLSEIIKDKEIIDFIYNFEKKEEKIGLFNYFKKDKINLREKYFKDINLILEKMEVWGE